MRFIHTSDWHLGQTLLGRRRYGEMESFLNWLLDLIQDWGADLLLVSGDVFDSTTPGSRAQELYFRFLSRLSDSGCRAVITAGNHDSPSLMDAPKLLLREQGIYISAVGDEPSNEIFPVTDSNGDPLAMVCAVPYLRDRDLYLSRPGESLEDKGQRLIQGIRDHYKQCCDEAVKIKVQSGFDSAPLLAMGHLFAAGGKTYDDDGVRDLYVGTLARVGADCFPQVIDYTALGHLHFSQRVAGQDNIRYSGSPLAMGFGEAGQTKSVVLGEWDGLSVSTSIKDIPVFQRLEKTSGDMVRILSDLQCFKGYGSSVWVEVEYDGKELVPDLRERIEDAVAGSDIEILRIRNRRMVVQLLQDEEELETLEDLEIPEVFRRRLEASEIPDEQQKSLQNLFLTVLKGWQEKDLSAEADE